MNEHQSEDQHNPPPHPLSGRPIDPSDNRTPYQQQQDDFYKKNDSMIRLAIAGSGLLSLSGLFFLPLLAPFLLRIFLKDRTMRFDEQLCDEVNFQITWLILLGVCAVLAYIGVLLSWLLLPMVLLVPAFMYPIVYLILTVWSIIKVSSNPDYKHSFSYKFI